HSFRRICFGALHAKSTAGHDRYAKVTSTVVAFGGVAYPDPIAHVPTNLVVEQLGVYWRRGPLVRVGPVGHAKKEDAPACIVKGKYIGCDLSPRAIALSSTASRRA